MSGIIEKLGAVTSGGTMTLTVAKTGGPIVTRADVGSTGNDDREFTDEQLTPGPATMPLDPDNAYSIVWSGGFVGDGSARLDVVVDHGQGGPPSTVSRTQPGRSGDVFFRVVLVP